MGLFKPKAPKGTVALAARGVRYPIRMDNKKRNTRWWIMLSGVLTVTVAAAGAVKNHGLLSDVMQFSVSENGEDTYGPAYGFLLRHMSQLRAGAPLPKVSLFDQGVSTAALPIGVYPLSETFTLDFADPRTIDPMETAFMEIDNTAYLELQAELTANAEQSLVAPGAATVVLSGVTMTVWQDYASGTVGSRPLWKPRMRQFSQPLTGANQDDQFPVKSQAAKVRSVTLGAIATDADGGTVIVSDAITALRLIGDTENGNIIGPNKANFKQLVNSQRMLAGGDVAALDAFYTAYFAEYGRHSNVINPLDFPNLRYEMQDAVSASGATQVVALLEELTTPPQNPGNRVTSAALPEWAK